MLGTSVTITGKQTFIAGENPIDVTCKSASVELTAVNAITLNQTGKIIAMVNADGTRDLSGRASVQGSVTTPSNAYLEIVIEASKTKRTDAAIYTCTLAGSKTGDTAHRDTASMTIRGKYLI